MIRQYNKSHLNHEQRLMSNFTNMLILQVLDNATGQKKKHMYKHKKTEISENYQKSNQIQDQHLSIN